MPEKLTQPGTTVLTHDKPGGEAHQVTGDYRLNEEGAAESLRTVNRLRRHPGPADGPVMSRRPRDARLPSDGIVSADGYRCGLSAADMEGVARRPPSMSSAIISPLAES
jgi:hypothetical protein